jgi:hypothetical protein
MGVKIADDFMGGEPDDDAMAAPSDPMGVARVLIRDQQTAGGELKLRHWRGSWMEWQGTHWVEAEDKAIRSWLYQRLEDAKYWHFQPASSRRDEIRELRPWNPNRHKIGDVLEALAAVTHTPEWIDTPSWLNPVRGGPRDQSNYRASEIVACSNGLLHVGTRKLLELTPAVLQQGCGSIRLRSGCAAADTLAAIPQSALARRFRVDQHPARVLRIRAVGPYRLPQDHAPDRPEPVR